MEYLSYFSQKIWSDISCKLSPKYQIIISGEKIRKYHQKIKFIINFNRFVKCLFQKYKALISEQSLCNVITVTSDISL